MKPITIVKTVASTLVPEVLGESILRGTTITFTGMKAARTPNVGTVWVQMDAADGSPGLQLLPAQTISWPAGVAGSFTANDFWIDVENAGDGVIAFISK